jgi:hypothetical protein
MQRRHHAVRRYLLKNYGDIAKAFKCKTNPRTAPAAPYPVWVCWWQGAEAMPPLVRACYNSLLRSAGTHPVHLLTGANYQEFIDLPDFILEKFKKGIITPTHLSDILRMGLLYKHGGFWLDATVLVTAPLPDFAGQELFTLKRAPDNQYVAQGRWSAYLFYLNRGNLLADFLNTLFAEYWRRESDLCNFFLIDYCIALAYDFIPAVKELLDAVPRSNPQIYALRKKLAAAYAEPFYQELVAQNVFHKLTYKADFPERTADGARTFYGQLLKTYL